MPDRPKTPTAACAGVEIVPLASPDPALIDRIAAALRVSLGCAVSVAPPEKIPQIAYSANRGQYDASTILDAVRPSVWKKGWKRLAIAGADLFASGLNFVFGQADVSGSVAVISLARLSNQFYGLPPDPDLFVRRALKEALHEIGHTFGLVHCKMPCVMYFSNSLTDTDRKSAGFCDACLARLAAKEK